MAERSILITGCSSGIGEACARGMKQRGWRVIATARRTQDIDRLKDEGLEVLHLDYTDPASIEKLANDVLELTGGRLFALFNNGAYGQPGAVEDLPVDALRAQFETNVFGWHDLTCRLVPAMRANRRGRIVQCSSVLGLVVLKWRGAYAASKFATEALANTMRLELAGSGVHICQIQPGPVRTKFRETAQKYFRRNIDIEASVHANTYRWQLGEESEGPTPTKSRFLTTFTLEPESVLEKLIHATESANPKPQYYVTVPTHVMTWARRLLPARAMDALQHKVS